MEEWRVLLNNGGETLRRGGVRGVGDFGDLISRFNVRLSLESVYFGGAAALQLAIRDDLCDFARHL
jgi:hypothetical protein